MRLRNIRKERGWTQKQLAEKAGIAREVVARIETGASQPTLSTLLKIAAALGVPITDLIEKG